MNKILPTAIPIDILRSHRQVQTTGQPTFITWPTEGRKGGEIEGKRGRGVKDREREKGSKKIFTGIKKLDSSQGRRTKNVECVEKLSRFTLTNKNKRAGQTTKFYCSWVDWEAMAEAQQFSNTGSSSTSPGIFFSYTIHLYQAQGAVKNRQLFIPCLTVQLVRMGQA